jgi:hypothetical protein
MFQLALATISPAACLHSSLAAGAAPVLKSQKTSVGFTNLCGQLVSLAAKGERAPTELCLSMHGEGSLYGRPGEMLLRTGLDGSTH